MFELVLDPSEVATSRTELALNDGIGISIDQKGIDWGDAAIQAFMADLSTGSVPVDSRIPNRLVTIPFGLGMGVGTQTDFLQTRTALQQKVGLLQREGGWLKRGGVRSNLYADVVNATLTIPDVWGEPGNVEPNCLLVLECLPDFYGDELTLDAITAVTGITSQVLLADGVAASIRGDHPGRVRIALTNSDTAYGAIFGFRSRHYDAAAPLVYEAEALVIDGGSSIASLTGASGGHVVTHGSLLAGAPSIPVVTFANPFSAITHLGNYRLWARIHLLAGDTVHLQAQWGSANTTRTIGPTRTIAAALNEFRVVDLGTVSLPVTPFTVHGWNGYIAAGGAVGGESVSIDWVALQPIDESSGHVTGDSANDVPVAYDTFGAELRTEGSWFSAGLLGWGPIPGQYGDLPRIPPSGLEDRPVELFIAVLATDLDEYPDALIDFSAVVSYRPCYLFATNFNP